MVNGRSFGDECDFEIDMFVVTITHINIVIASYQRTEIVLLFNKCALISLDS